MIAHEEFIKIKAGTKYYLVFLGVPHVEERVHKGERDKGTIARYYPQDLYLDKAEAELAVIQRKLQL